MMFSRYLLVESLSVLGQYKLRSILTVFGIMWGVAAFTFSHAVLQGFQSEQSRRFAAMGKDLLIVEGRRSSYVAPGEMTGREVRLELDDLHALTRQTRLIRSISPESVRPQVRASRQGASLAASLHGVWPEHQKIRSMQVTAGRLLHRGDEQEARRVCVVTEDIAVELLGAHQNIPASIKLDHLTYVVVAVAKKRPQAHKQIFIPFRSMQRDFPQSRIALVVQPVSPDFHGRLVQEIRSILAQRHGFRPDDPDALSIFDTVQNARNVGNVFSGLALFSDISAITTVLMGAIGLTNILLVSVRERTREIGIRRSVGARSRHITIQLFCEGLILSGVGGFAGLLLGSALSLLLGLIPIPGFTSPSLRLEPALVACSVILIVGLTASTYPALKAARINPVEALRRG